MSTNFNLRVKANEGGFVESREVPITHSLISATTIGGADTIYTVRDVNVKVKRLTVANTSGSAADLSLFAVPDGGSAATANTELGAVSVPANTSVDLTDLIGGFYTENMTLEAFASTTDVLVMHGWVEEIL